MNVAIVRLSALGDVVHGLPVATRLRARRPHARITWVVERRHGVVLRNHPALDAVVEVEPQRWRGARRVPDLVAAVRAIADTRRRLRERQFDVAIDAQGLLKSGLVTAATGAPIRVGFARHRCREPLSALFTNHHVDPPPSAAHVVDQNLALLDALGVEHGEDVRFDLPADPQAEALADEFFAASGLKPRDGVVIFNPGAGRPAKRWPPERFGELGRRITEAGTGKVLVVWGPAERDLAQAIVDRCASGDAVVAPPTDVHGLVAILRRASVIVSGDSGPLHLAAAVGVPCVGLFGPTLAARNGPYGSIHRTLQSRDATLGAIESADVFDRVRTLLA